MKASKIIAVAVISLASFSVTAQASMPATGSYLFCNALVNFASSVFEYREMGHPESAVIAQVTKNAQANNKQVDQILLSTVSAVYGSNINEKQGALQHIGDICVKAINKQ